MTEYEAECFFIAPIGKAGTEIRKRSDNIRDHVVRPAAAKLGMETVRADDVTSPGQITLQVIEHLLRARAVVADLTGANANVYYELAIRHAARLPVVLIASEADIDVLPFDIQNMRVIPLDHQDLASADKAEKQIEDQLRAALDGAVDSPVYQALTLEALSNGDTEQQTLAHLVTRVEELAQVTQQLSRQVGVPVVSQASRTADLFDQVFDELDRRLPDYGVSLDSMAHGDDGNYVVGVYDGPSGRRRRFMFSRSDFADLDTVVALIVATMQSYRSARSRD